MDVAYPLRLIPWSIGPGAQTGDTLFCIHSVGNVPGRRVSLAFRRPHKSKVPAEPAKYSHQIAHVVILRWKILSADAESEDPVDAAGHSTGVIPMRRQSETAVGNDAAAAAKIGKPTHDTVDRRTVKRTEKPLPASFDCAFDYDVLRKLGKNLIYPITRSLGADNDPHTWAI